MGLKGITLQGAEGQEEEVASTGRGCLAGAAATVIRTQPLPGREPEEKYPDFDPAGASPWSDPWEREMRQLETSLSAVHPDEPSVVEQGERV